MKPSLNNNYNNHPLKSPKSPYSTFNLSPSSSSSTSTTHLSYYSDTEYTTTYSPTPPRASTSSLTPTGSSTSDLIRRRGSSTNLNSNYNSNTNDLIVDSDITRPSLRRVTTNATNKLKLNDSSSKARRSFDELSRARMDDGSDQADREVVIHQLIKTDSIASISLSYGITPQALRLSNRLWPSDSIHLRKSLNIPLDLCHLPSSSGIERIQREEDGNLIVWEREPEKEREREVRSTSLSVGEIGFYGGSGIGGSALGLRGLTGGRRTASASASASTLDLNRGTSSAGGSTFDLLGSFSDLHSTTTSSSNLNGNLPRTSLDSYGDLRSVSSSSTMKMAPSLLVDGKNSDDAVLGYLPSTNNPYTFSNSTTTTSNLKLNNSVPPSPTLSPHYSNNNNSTTSNYFNPHEYPSSLPPSRINSPETYPTSSNPTSPPLNPINSNFNSHSSNSNANISNQGTLSRRTLQISKVPNSSLSFFPPPNPSFYSSTGSNSTIGSSGGGTGGVDLNLSDGFGLGGEVLYRDNKTGLISSIPAKSAINGVGGEGRGEMMSATGNGSGARRLKGKIKDRKDSTTMTSSSSSGPIGTALGLLNLSGSLITGSSTSTTNTSSNGGASGKQQKHWSDRWNLSYFGGEEEELANAAFNPSNHAFSTLLATGGARGESGREKGRGRGRTGSEHELTTANGVAKGNFEESTSSTLNGNVGG